MLSENSKLYDITIIGGGPAGLFASFYAGLREMKTKIIEADNRLGGKVHVYPQKMVWDVGGQTPLTGRELINQSIEQGLSFSPTVVLEQVVTTIEKKNDGTFLVMTTKGVIHHTKTVVIATGSGGIIKPMKLEVPKATKFEEENLYYEVFDVNDFRGKSLLISGGSPTSIDWGNDLAPIAKDITLVYRGDDLKGLEATKTKLINNGVKILFNTQIHELIGINKINEVVLYNNKNQEIFNVKVDAVLVNHGYHKNNPLLNSKPLGLELTEHLYINGNSAGHTTIPGIYGAGDCVLYDGKLQLIAGAYQDAANAVNSAKLYIEPDAHKVAQVSSHNNILDEKNKKYLYR
ncbi:NAD(P)/FAD-dependent oxidoreductase [Alkalihalobacillus oceani]|uniref:Ferredoxin--NADP reductase n=1 Tax=Halalkalibacter oceani TaxID=1653776 RepID=A0A9X2DN49_9BACI|nr:NAD(P)/FAD-dependent oxidoreductase [Halalkalibacter oceani]MCM3713759.1 NAD(P)/FAD-dependent oxidoreductase [Halalkalibacter oceani]